jgi:hypothetical protein
MLKFEKKADLQRLIDDEILESYVLDYKASPALAKDSKSRDELCKDVSAFANSAGGQIIYGIVEDKHLPKSIDPGVDQSVITKEWIEQVLNSNIQPRIRDLVIAPIPLRKGRWAYVLTIPQSNTAHQAPDKKYYRRGNFESVPMHDQEVRDVMRRATTAEPFILLQFPDGDSTSARPIEGEDEPRPVELHVKIGNKSPQPAFYTLVTVAVDAQLKLYDTGGWIGRKPIHTSKGHDLVAVEARVAIPAHMPVFQEAVSIVGAMTFVFQFRTAQDHYLVRCTVQTPGYSNTEDWIIHRSGTRLTLEGPLPPIHPL